jgi:hypothetical protein
MHGGKSIITLTNPVLQSNAVLPSVPPHQAVDYEDNEELNSRMPGIKKEFVSRMALS